MPVLKQNNDVRICRDYQVTVNQEIKIDSYPLPQIKNYIFAAFSKLHMAKCVKTWVYIYQVELIFIKLHMYNNYL